MDELTKKWEPVLRKCREIPEDNWFIAARFFENVRRKHSLPQALRCISRVRAFWDSAFDNI